MFYCILKQYLEFYLSENSFEECNELWSRPYILHTNDLNYSNRLFIKLYYQISHKRFNFDANVRKSFFLSFSKYVTLEKCFFFKLQQFWLILPFQVILMTAIHWGPRAGQGVIPWFLPSKVCRQSGSLQLHPVDVKYSSWNISSQGPGKQSEFHSRFIIQNNLKMK